MNCCIGTDRKGWGKKFAEALDQFIQQGYPLAYQFIDLERSDWIDRLDGFDAVIWNPSYMGIRLSSHFKEKIYFMEEFLGLRVIPNYQTVWTFESKIAQSYLFKKALISTPSTTASFLFEDAINQFNCAQLPIVVKNSEGAGSSTVRLINSKRKYYRELVHTFAEQIWAKERLTKTAWKTIQTNLNRYWLWCRLMQRLRILETGSGVAYWQAFVPGNPSDLRITVIGDQYAYGFWRNNRPHDFRASGSGRIDYQRPIPEEALRYCQSINQRFGFDSMAYDLLLKDDDFVITEMSYNYKDSALFNTPGYYFLGKQIEFVSEQIWPQTLWVKAFIEKSYETKGTVG